MKFFTFLLILSVYLNAQTIFFKGLEYKVVTSPITDKQWLDRNLGAQRDCQALDDKLCFGDYYQWGRKTNGHEKISNDLSTKKRVKEDLKKDGMYIIVKKSPTFDWRIDQNDNLWKGADALNNVCPKGFKIPSKDEIESETVMSKVSNTDTAFSNFLKIPSSGFRTLCSGEVTRIGKNGSLWTSSAYERESYYLDFNKVEAVMTTGARAEGLPVRCMKN